MGSRFLPLLALAACLAAGAPAQAQDARLELVGVNIAGAEFNGAKMPGVVNKDYVYPDKKSIDYFAASGMNVIRVPFRWERLQRSLDAGLDPTEQGRLDAVVDYATAKQVRVILDPHNYGRYNRQTIGSAEVPDAAFAAFWKALAEHYKDNDRVIFGLMNEPHGIRADTWAASAQAAIDAIRATGARNLILVPGTAWSGAHSWQTRYQGVSNAEALEKIVDPAGGPLAFEAHQYLDKDYSGSNAQCRSETIGVEKLRGFTDWLRKTGSRGFLGEFGVSTDPVCLKALDLMLAYMAENADVWMGWTYWAAGSWWGKYMFSVQPDADGAAKPQMAVLLRHVPKD
jgi:endoglucanase